MKRLRASEHFNDVDDLIPFGGSRVRLQLVALETLAHEQAAAEEQRNVPSVFGSTRWVALAVHRIGLAHDDRAERWDAVY